MFDEERKSLEEERNNLKDLLDFYVKFSHRITSMNQSEVDNHVDSILDRLNELKKLLES